MKIKLRLFSSLNQYNNCEDGPLEIESNQTISQLIEALEIPKERIGIISINGRRADESTRLKDGDALAIFPMIEGG